MFWAKSTRFSRPSTGSFQISWNIWTLRQFLYRELWKIETRDPNSFSYIAECGEENRPQFVSILKHLILNFKVRFYTPSFSLDKRAIKDYLDYDNVLISPRAPPAPVERCGLSNLLDVLTIRQPTLPVHLLNTMRHHGICDEWTQLDELAFRRLDDVFQKVAERETALGLREKSIKNVLQMQQRATLIDAFQLVERSSFSIMWLFVVRLLTVIPTTVACEQSFSFFKRSLHINMSEETAKIFLNARMGLYKRIYTL